MKKITVDDVLNLVDVNREGLEQVVITDGFNEDKNYTIPTSGRLLSSETLNREVEAIGVEQGMIQIWIKEKKVEE